MEAFRGYKGGFMFSAQPSQNGAFPAKEPETGQKAFNILNPLNPEAWTPKRVTAYTCSKLV